MNALVSIAAPSGSALLESHRIHDLPVLVIFPHNQCNCRCVMCDIWRLRETKQISPEDLDRHLSSFHELGVRWVVFSGGEPQLNDRWSQLAQMLRTAGIRVTMLTAGLLLKQQAQAITECIDDLIISLDGPPATHDKIRRVPGAFQKIAEGIDAIHQLRPDMALRARCTVQKTNHQSLRAVVASARGLGLTSVSFLAADLTSSAFNRPEGWLPDRVSHVALSPQETDELEIEVERLIVEQQEQPGFVVEGPRKLRKIVQHFRAHLGQGKESAPRCNAPWVSSVIEATGDVRPCFFHPVLGNIHRQSLQQIINSPAALQFRSTLNVEENEICRRCVCSLYIAHGADSA